MRLGTKSQFYQLASNEGGPLQNKGQYEHLISNDFTTPPNL